MKSNTLTAAFVKSVRHRGGRTADRYSDGHGLMLQVMPANTKQWLQRIALNGRRYDYGLGGYPAVGLAEARLTASRNLAEARAYRLGVHRGEEPPLPGFERGRRATVALRSGRPAPAGAAASTGLRFGRAWELTIAERSKGWKNPKTDIRSWRADLRIHLSALARLPVASVGVDHLREALAPLKPATTSKVLRRCGTVFKWAIAGGHRADNPAHVLRDSWAGLNGHAKQHRAALPWREVPAFYARLTALGTPEALALGLVVLTGLRSREGREARYEEIDFEARTLKVPGGRMKDGQEFRAALSTAALRLLDAAGPRRKAGLVFRAPKGGPLADKALRAVLAGLGTDATVHGFRSSFRDWCGEQGVARELAEGCLSHKVGSSVEQAYARSDLLERRREVMEQWGRLVEGAG